MLSLAQEDRRARNCYHHLLCTLLLLLLWRWRLGKGWQQWLLVGSWDGLVLLLLLAVNVQQEQLVHVRRLLLHHGCVAIAAHDVHNWEAQLKLLHALLLLE